MEKYKEIEKFCREVVTAKLLEAYPRGCDYDDMKKFLAKSTPSTYHYYVCWAMLYGQPYDNIIRLIIKNGKKITGISQ